MSEDFVFKNVKKTGTYCPAYSFNPWHRWWWLTVSVWCVLFCRWPTMVNVHCAVILVL